MKAEMERWKEEAKQEDSKSGEREVQREEERVGIKRRCRKRRSRNVFEDWNSMAGFSVCVPAVSSFGTVVTVVLVSPGKCV